MSVHSDSFLRVRAHRLHNGRTLVIPIGDIDLLTQDQLREVLATCDGNVVIDLAGVGSVDSRGLAVICEQRNRLHDSGGSLALHSPRPNVRRAIEAIGLDTWIAA